MEILDIIFDSILPIVIIGFLIYFSLIIITVIITVIRVKKADKTTEICMTKAGVAVHSLVFALYILLIGYSIYNFVGMLSNHAGFMKSISAFNILTVFTLLYSSFIQDFLFVSKRALIRGNHLYEFRRIKKVTYPKKHKMNFVYGQNELHLSTWFVDMTKLKRKLVK